MFARIQAARKNESGFTLIELLIVIVILGVLAGIVVFSVSGITNRGDAAACKANVKTVQVAQEAYYAKTTPSAYAASVTALVTAGLLADPAPTDVATTTSGAVTHTCSFT
jgi:general secretion pathway protein G